MNKLLAVALLSACGGGFQGKVSGHTLAVTDTFFLSDSSSAVLVLTDQSDLCTALAAPKAPPNATAMAFTLMRRSDSSLLAPDTGDYTVSTTPGSGDFATGLFLNTDANANSTVPAENSVAVSGLLTVDNFTDGKSMTGSFDGRFGTQNDVVTFAFNAHYCAVNPQAFAQGFLGGGHGSLPGGSGGSCSTSGTCIEYVGSSFTASSAQSSCSQSSGSWSAGACAQSSAGWCIMNGGTTTEVRWTVYNGVDVRSACTSGQFSQN